MDERALRTEFAARLAERREWKKDSGEATLVRETASAWISRGLRENRALVHLVAELRAIELDEDLVVELETNFQQIINALREPGRE